MSDDPHDDVSVTIANDIKAQEQGERSGQSSMYSCPDCGGVLWEFDEGETPEFSCHTGHRYSGDALVSAQSHVLQQALQEAVRVLREKATLLRQLAVKSNPRSATTGHLIAQADQDDEHARLIQTQLLDGDAAADGPADMTAEVVGQLVREMRRRPDD
jgi:two-component system, chemotaxis family, protein-glutamate methylesterase/glutaminase